MPGRKTAGVGPLLLTYNVVLNRLLLFNLSILYMASHSTQIISDDNDIEILVGYDYERSQRQIEECHGFHEKGNLVSIDLTSVEVIIKGTGVDILPSLTKQQKDEIIEKIQID